MPLLFYSIYSLDLYYIIRILMEYSSIVSAIPMFISRLQFKDHTADCSDRYVAVLNRIRVRLRRKWSRYRDPRRRNDKSPLRLSHPLKMVAVERRLRRHAFSPDSFKLCQRAARKIHVPDFICRKRFLQKLLRNRNQIFFHHFGASVHLTGKSNCRDSV